MSLTSAPVSSHKFAISLIKEILVAKKALEAYLDSSDVCKLVRTTGVSLRYNGKYNS